MYSCARKPPRQTNTPRVHEMHDTSLLREAVMAGSARTSAYDRYADEYAAYVTTREQDGPGADPFGMLSHILTLLGDVSNQDVLDAGCGEGYLARILAGRGARVTGVDLS